MKRILVLGSTFLLCGLFIGCGTDSREGLIDDTINMIQQAATDVGNIKSRVNEAIKKSEEKQTKLDLSDAMKAADQLKKIGETAQTIKRRLKQKTELNKSLTKAEEINTAAKESVEKLREKIRDAESPFESLAR